MKRVSAVIIGRTIMGAVAVGGIGVSLSLFSTSDLISPGVIALGAMHGFGQQIFMIAATESRSRSEPLRFANQNLARSLGMVCIALPSAVLFNSAALIIFAETFVTVGTGVIVLRGVFRELGISVLAVATLAARSIQRTNWRNIAQLMVLSMAITASCNSDRWISSTILLPTEFANYSFAWLIMIVAYMVQSLVSASAFPAIAKRAGTVGARSAFKLAAMASFGMLTLCLALLAPAAIVAGLVVERYYPAYESAAPLIPVLGIAAAFRVSDFWTSFLIVTGKEKVAIGINVLTIAASIAIWYILFSSQPTPMSLAYLAALTAGSVFLMSCLASYRYERASAPRAFH